jgi:PhoD-like phosphatase
MTENVDRRSFLKRAGSTTLSAAALRMLGPSFFASAETSAGFQSAWPEDAVRVWPGPEYWANPLQDWQIRRGRLECIASGGDRNVALLTREISERSGDLHLRLKLGKLDGALPTEGFVGFRVGSKHQMNDYRATAIYGRGMNAGIDATGRLFIGELHDAAPRIDMAKDILLELHARPSIAGYTVVLRATPLKSGNAIEVGREVPGEWLTGGLALVCSSAPVEATPAEPLPIKDFDFYPPQQKKGGSLRFWFADWTVTGSKVDANDNRAYGPTLFTLYTLSRGILKLSAQFPPLGNAAKTVTLQLRDMNGQWRTAATSELHPYAWNAEFRLTSWDSTRETAYRVLYAMPGAGGSPKQHIYEGVIRKDPKATQELTVGLLTCLWDFGFPHTDFVKHLCHHKPDLLFWTGDQIYEAVGGFGSIQSREPSSEIAAMLDYQRKWFIFGWAVRDLTREIPSVCMTDDHDMFHGNLWGCGGRPTNPAATTTYSIQDSGGYKMSPQWVDMVQRVQTSHLPDPVDATPVKQNISVYYTELQYGGVSFAILEDRKWKSAPRQQLLRADIVNGFPQNLEWNPTDRNAPDAELLGQRQLDFLEYWATDWGNGTWMKFAVSQTLFGCLHTEPAGENKDDDDPHLVIPAVGDYIEGDHMVADHDSGAWPQNERDAGILKWRKAFAAHLCGDQHLPTTSIYGVKEFRDGVYSICTPAISNIFPRRWFPPSEAPNAVPGTRNTGDYFDAFGNRMTVLAVANPARHPGPGLDGLRFRVTGYTIVKCNRVTRQTVAAMWPRWVDPSAPGAKPYDGWPIMFHQLDNGLSGAEWELERIDTPDFQDAVVQVQNTATGEVVYTVRANGTSFTPLVRTAGTYSVLAYDPDGDYRKEWPRLEARKRPAI